MAQTTQINVRMEDTFLGKARRYAKKHGFSNVQELMKETLRERLFDESRFSNRRLMLEKFREFSRESTLTEKEALQLGSEVSTKATKRHAKK